MSGFFSWFQESRMIPRIQTDSENPEWFQESGMNPRIVIEITWPNRWPKNRCLDEALWLSEFSSLSCWGQSNKHFKIVNPLNASFNFSLQVVRPSYWEWLELTQSLIRLRKTRKRLYWNLQIKVNFIESLPCEDCFDDRTVAILYHTSRNINY